MIDKLLALLPLKNLIKPFLAAAEKLVPEYDETELAKDPFLKWLNDKVTEFNSREADRVPQQGSGFLPDRGTGKGRFIPMQKISMSILMEDKVYRNSIAGLVALVRSGPAPPLEDWEKRRIEERYRVKVV